VSLPSRRVLVTYGWCRTAYLAVRSLSRGGYRVYTCSGHAPSMSGWSRFSRGSAAVADPFAAPEEFSKDVGRLVQRWSIDVVLPGHEDALALRQFEHHLPEGVQIACPLREQLERAVDKAEVTRAALAASVPVPASRFPASVDEAVADAESIGFPIVAKLRRSNSGKGVAAAGSTDDLVGILTGRFASFCSSPIRFPILQELLPGQVVGACFLAEKGRVVAVFAERYVRCKDGRFGTSVFREPLRWPRLDEHVAAMVAQLSWTGIGHFDFIEDAGRDEAFLLEMNPRLWGAVNLAYVNGFDFPAALVAQTRGEGNLGRFFASDYGRELRSIWLVGEMIGAVNRWQAGERLGPARTAWDLARVLPRSRFDDFVWHDPLALVAEGCCYTKLFIRSGGDTNPVGEGMFQ